MVHRFAVYISDDNFTVFEFKNRKLEEISYRGENVVLLKTGRENILEILGWIKENFELIETDLVDLLVISDNNLYGETIQKFFSCYSSEKTEFSKKKFFEILLKKLKYKIISINTCNGKKTVIEKFENIYKNLKFDTIQEIKEYYVYSREENFFDFLEELDKEEIRVQEKIERGSLKEYCILKTENYRKTKI